MLFYSKIRIFKVVRAPQNDPEYFLINIGGGLVLVLNVSASRIVLSERKRYLKKLLVPSAFFTQKSEFFKVIGEIQNELEYFWKKYRALSWYQFKMFPHPG